MAVKVRRVLEADNGELVEDLQNGWAAFPTWM